MGMENSLKYPEDLIKKARGYLSDGEKELKSILPNSSNIIANCQRAIELSAKAVLKMMELDFPREHQLLFEQKEEEVGKGKKRKVMKVRGEIKKILQKEFPKHFIYKEDIPRLFFLTYFWHQFRTIAEYGIEELNIPPDKLFRKEDAKLAVEHAELCVKIAYNLLSQLKLEKR